jgi:RNA polymerase sigma-70 factor, ECF subfamily
MNQETTTNLIERSKNDNQTAFRLLVEAHQFMVYRLSFRLLCNEEDARDAVQETFIRCWLSLKSFDYTRNFSTWIYAIASHYCYDKLKASKKNLFVPLEERYDKTVEDNPESQLLNRELGNKIAAFTEGLSPKQKLVFTLKELEDLEIQDITEITEMTPNQIKSNLHHAKSYLQKKLQSNDYEPRR